MNARSHVTQAVTGAALGAVTAQQAIEKVRANSENVPIAWHEYVQLAAKYGWRSPACAAFVDQLAKAAAASRAD
jgi:hypothetical protein